MKAVIMAGGLGERLKPLTKIIPKPLLPVGNESVLEIQILNLKASGVTEIILALGHKPELFLTCFGDGSKWGLKIRHSIEDKPLGTAGPLTLLRDQLQEPFLVINGDILTDMDYDQLKRAHLESGADVTVTTTNVKLPLQYGVIRHEGDRILDIEEKCSLSAEINAGIYCMEPKIVDLMPYNAFVSMDKLLNELITAGFTVSRFLLSGYWLDIGQMADLEKANELRSGAVGESQSEGLSGAMASGSRTPSRNPATIVKREDACAG